jgi:hypothetical protein
VEDRQLHGFRSPVAGEYTDVFSTARPGRLTVAGLPDLAVDSAVDLAQLFG